MIGTRLSTTTIALPLLCMVVVLLSQLDCFHVHYGISRNIRDLEHLGKKKGVDGYMNYKMRARGPVQYDQEAFDMMRSDPDFTLDGLDLEIVISVEEIGFDPSKENAKDGKGFSVGMRKDAPIITVTGEMIRRARKLKEEEMPQPGMRS